MVKPPFPDNVFQKNPLTDGVNPKPSPILPIRSVVAILW